MTRILVTGSRNWTDKPFIMAALKTLQVTLPVVFIHGAARGADTLAAECADELGWTLDPHPADWKKYGDSAGPLRNNEMLDLHPDFVVAFHDNLDASRGTKHCVAGAKSRGIPVHHFSHFQVGYLKRM